MINTVLNQRMQPADSSTNYQIIHGLPQQFLFRGKLGAAIREEVFTT
jgi:hypothetical protein